MPTLTRHWYGSNPALDALPGLEAATSGADKIIDLKGGRHVLGERHLSLQDHSYVIRNGTLADGEVLIGPRIDARRIEFRNVNFSNVKLRCGDELACELRFIDCAGLEGCSIQADRLLFTRAKTIQNTDLTARELTLEDCWSLQGTGTTGIAVAGTVRLSARDASPRTKLRGLDFKGGGGSLHLDRASVRECSIRGKYESVRLLHTDFTDCKVIGAATRWHEEDVTHKAEDKRSGRWDVDVSGDLALKEVSFDALTVNSEVIANQCEDRSSVDIQNAHVDNEWELLRDNYSGTLLAFHLMFLLAFVAPLFSKIAAAAGFAGLSLQSRLIGGQEAWPTIAVWEILLFGFYGRESVLGWWHAFLTVALLIYNVGRIYLTVTIVKLRSREEHLSVQRFRRARPAAAKYEFKILVHRFIMRPLFLLAILSAGWKIWDAVKLHIPIPPGT